MTSAAFTYAPLCDKPGAFRLLRLKKGTGAKLEAQLIHTTADEAYDHYEAISYTWGNPAKLDYIFIDDQPLAITYNLSIALHDLRLPDMDRVIWNDATCINQEDLVERGQQVQQMGKFYSNAKAVLFYIGQTTVLTDVFMDTLNAFWRGPFQSNNSLQILTVENELEWRRKWQDFLKDYQHEQFMLIHRMTLAHSAIMAESWFRRIWVVQEVFNARQGFVYCGQKHVPAEVFSLCAKLFGSEQEQIAARPLLDLMSKSHSSSVSEEHHIREQHSLHELITTFSTSEATDQYDRIYALLSMTAENISPATLRADYTIDFAQVIVNTIGHICQWPEIPSASDSPCVLPFNNIDDFIKSLCNPKEHFLLLWGIQCGYAPLVQYMLDQGCNPTVRVFTHEKSPFKGGIPICMAAEKGHDSVVELMVAAIKVGSATTTAERWSRSPLHYAAKNGHTTVVEILIASGLFEVDVLDDGGFSPLSYAAEGGHEAVVKVLLATCEVDPNRKDKNGNTPLALAATGNHEAVLKLLLATAQVDVNSRNLEGASPLHLAAQNGAYAVAKELLATHEINVNISRPNGHHLTPLRSAVANGRVEIVKLLLDSERELDLKSPKEVGTLLHLAARLPRSGAEILELLLATGQFDVDERDSQLNETPLAVAVNKRNEAVVEFLASYPGVDVNAAGLRNNTIMDYAAMKDNARIMRALLATGRADVHKDSTGFGSPWTIAKSRCELRHRQDIIDLFYEYKYV